MSKYCNILAAIDLTQQSRLVIEKALQISQGTESTLDAVYVINFDNYYSKYLDHFRNAVYDDEVDVFAKYCDEYGIDKERRHVHIGSPRIHILEQADNLNSDLIVVGSHGEHHMLPATFGSTATSILSKAVCDVLVVSNHHQTEVNQETQSAVA